MGEWEERFWGTWAHRSYHFTLVRERKEDITCHAVLCAKFRLTAETRINTLHMWRRGGMLQVKHMSWWMLQQAEDTYRNLQIQRQEFFLHFQKLSTRSLGAEGILQEQQAPSARCKGISHSLTWAGQPPAQKLVPLTKVFTSSAEMNERFCALL